MDKKYLAKIYKEFCRWVLAESNNPDSKVHRQGLCSSLWEYAPKLGLSYSERWAICSYQSSLFSDAGLALLYPWNSNGAHYRLVMRVRQAMQGARLEWVKEHAQ